MYLSLGLASASTSCTSSVAGSFAGLPKVSSTRVITRRTSRSCSSWPVASQPDTRVIRSLLCRSSSDRSRRHNKNRHQPQSHPGTLKDDPLALAFLGDAIWSLCVRNHFLNPPKHFRLYQSAVKPLITAEGQARVYDVLVSQQLLVDEEVSLLTSVYNWHSVKFRKRFSTSASEDVYRKATALEALVGHLHLHDRSRLHSLVEVVLQEHMAAEQSCTTQERPAGQQSSCSGRVQQ